MTTARRPRKLERMMGCRTALLQRCRPEPVFAKRAQLSTAKNRRRSDQNRYLSCPRRPNPSKSRVLPSRSQNQRPLNRGRPELWEAKPVRRPEATPRVRVTARTTPRTTPAALPRAGNRRRWPQSPKGQSCKARSAKGKAVSGLKVSKARRRRPSYPLHHSGDAYHTQ